jgi:rhodanese-related sulfurtransferase
MRTMMLLSMTVALAAAAGTPAKISAKDASALIAKNKAVLVDVREAEETSGGVAQPAKLLPTSKINSDEKALKELLASVPKGTKVVFYCAAGGRAGRAAEKAAALGYEVANMGGYDDWVAAGLPTRKP